MELVLHEHAGSAFTYKAIFVSACRQMPLPLASQQS